MEKRKRNGLEVTCIGALYQGPWEKKYWSSSRGKDRYPYPVGYKAVRCYNGHSFHMEVQEGARGPLFVVFFEEGTTFSADTPTIAWQHALKKASSLSKKMLGRVLSTEINGSELFGFLDPLVQRLFRELVSLQDGVAQPDDNLSPVNKAGKIGQQEPTSLGSPGDFGWGSSRNAAVRKSRTSVVHSEAKASSLSGERGLSQAGCAKGGRKRLKLVKPSKKSRENSALELTINSDYSLPQGASSKLSQPRGGRRVCNIVTTETPQDHTCSGESRKVSNLAQENPMNEILQASIKGTLHCEGEHSGIVDPNTMGSLQKALGAVVPDTFDEFSSQILAGVEGIQTMFPLVNVVSDVRNKHLALTSAADICLPSQGMSPEKLRSLKQEIYIKLSQRKSPKRESQSQDLNSPSTNTDKSQLKNAVIPDSCDTDSGLMLINEAHSPTHGAIDDSQIAIVKSVVDLDKCEHSPQGNAKDDSQTSEGNTQKGESDSLGQELTKSMIRLLLPQALQLLNKKERKEKKPIISEMAHQEIMNEVEVADLPSVAWKLAGLDGKEPCCPTSFSNQVNMQVFKALDCPSSQREEIADISVEAGGISSGTDQLQLQSARLYQSSRALDPDGGLITTADRICLEKYDKVEEINNKLINEIDLCDTQPSNNIEYCGENSADVAHMEGQQAQRNSNHQLVSCTVFPCDNRVLLDKSAPVQSPAVEFVLPSKQQIHDANDRVSAPSLCSSPRTPLAEEEEYRNSANHNAESLEHSCPKILETKVTCSPSPKSTRIVETSNEFSNEMGADASVEESAIQFNTEKPSKDLEIAHNLGFDAHATSGGGSITITGKDFSAASPSCIGGKLQQKRSADSSVVLVCQEMNDLNHMETKCAADVCVEQRYGDVSKHEAKDSLWVHQHLLQPDTFVPKACLEHPMPVLAMKINCQDDRIRFLICCGFQNASRVLFIYQSTGKEFKPSLLSSITFDIPDYMCDEVCKGTLEANGIQFTPDGRELSLLGLFMIRETMEAKQACLVHEETRFHGIQLASYADGKICVHTMLSSSGRHVSCVLLLDTFMVIAGGESGFVTGWIMDTLWRSCKESFILPVPSSQGHQFSNVIQLSGVPALPWIVIGCDDQGLVAIWNSASRQLLRVSKLSVKSPLELHILHMNFVIENSCNELNRDPPILNVDDGSKVSEKVTAFFLVSTSDCNSMVSGDSAVQTVSKRWSLELFKRNCTSALFNLDQLHQRVSTVEVLDKLGVAGTNDGCVLFWDIMSGSVLRTFNELKGRAVTCIAGDRACSIVAAAGSDARVLIYMKQNR